MRGRLQSKGVAPLYAELLERDPATAHRLMPARSAEAAAGAIMDTRRYAKRQHTWFRNQMQDWPMVPAEEALTALESQLAS